MDKTMHILIIPGVTMPKVEDAVLARIRQAAGPDAKLTLAKSTQEAAEVMEDVEVILGMITPEMFKRAKKLTWVHAITSGADSYPHSPAATWLSLCIAIRTTRNCSMR